MGFAIGFLFAAAIIGGLRGVSGDAFFIGECVFFAAIAICITIEKR